MTNAHRQTERQTYVITCQVFNRRQQSAENSIKYHFGVVAWPRIAGVGENRVLFKRLDEIILSFVS